MKKGLLIAAALFAALALYVIWECLSFPPGRNRVPGPALYPTAVAILMLLSAVSIAVTALKLTPAENRPLGIFSGDNRRVYLSMLLLVLYVTAMYFVGFLTTSAAMLFGFIRWFGKYTPLTCALWAVGLSGAVYCVFRFILLVPFRFGVFL